MNNLNRHVKSDKIKWIATGIALLLISLVVVGVCLQVFGKGKQKPSEWFQNDETEQTAPADGEDGNKDNGGGATPNTLFDDTPNMHITVKSLMAYNPGGGIGLATRCPKCGDLSYVTITERRATCTVGGKSSSSCSTCGHTSSTLSEPLGHRAYRWVITTQPTADTAGVASYKCGYCSDVTETAPVYALPADPVKEGHVFVGWYMNEALTTPYDNSPIFANTKLYAKFDINTYTVTFDSDGGSEIVSITADWNTSITPEAPTKTGYTFKGWAFEDGTMYDNQSITDDVTLTAQWEPIFYKVTFYVDNEVYTTLDVRYGTSLANVAETAETMGLRLVSFNSAENVVLGDTDATAVELQGSQKAVNTVKNNMWQIVVCAACGVLFISVVAAVIGGLKRNKRR